MKLAKPKRGTTMETIGRISRRDRSNILLRIQWLETMEICCNEDMTGCMVKSARRVNVPIARIQDTDTMTRCRTHYASRDLLR